MDNKVSYLHKKVIENLETEKKGKLLDLGTGSGDLAKQAKDKGFEVVAFDLNVEPFCFKQEIKLCKGDLNQGLPFRERSFNHVVMIEVIEHLENPFFVLREINRILKPGGILILSTPNILNLKSRFRFLFEGTYDYYREPPLELFYSPKDKHFDIHLFGYKYPELEYILFKTNFKIENISSSVFEAQAIVLSFIFLSIIKLQAYLKCHRSKKKDIDYTRIFKILLSPALLYSRHLIIKACRTN
jgi:SAM-dependent methyltransferase